MCTWVSCGCPAENGIHGIPFTGCNTKLKGLLSTITMRSRSFDMQVRSLTCSLCSLQAYNIYNNAWNSSNRLHSKLQAQKHKIIVKFEKGFILIITQCQKKIYRETPCFLIITWKRNHYILNTDRHMDLDLKEARNLLILSE